MKSLYSLAVLLSLALLLNCIDARKDSGEYLRQGIDSKPRLVQGLDHVAKATSVSDEKKGDSKQDSVEPSLAKYKQLFTTDFEPRPTVTAYVGDLNPNDKQSYTKDFEPRPNFFYYHNDAKQEEGKSLVTDFEPRPNISAYDNRAAVEKATEAVEKGLEDGKNYKI